jgi:oxepin-CoA hydrolase/3-oxo-5,6-dehydrosuberyl-CoA semialdehyde dehydrogenase
MTHKRTVTEADIVNFAGISGDYFYAHTDETSLEGSIFERRVAHGYFLISAAAGLFVDPKKGPVLANYGLDNLRFVQPVYVGDTIQVQLTCMRKTMKDRREGQQPQGVVEWYVEVKN